MWTSFEVKKNQNSKKLMPMIKEEKECKKLWNDAQNIFLAGGLKTQVAVKKVLHLFMIFSLSIITHNFC